MTEEEVTIPVPRPKQNRVKAHPRPKQRNWIDSYIRRNPLKKHPPPRTVIIPIDPAFPDPSRKGVQETYSYQFVRNNPEVLDGLSPPDKRFIHLDRTENWLRFRMIDPTEMLSATYRTKIIDDDTQEIQAIHRTRKKWETQSIMKRRPEITQLVSDIDEE